MTHNAKLFFPTSSWISPTSTHVPKRKLEKNGRRPPQKNGMQKRLPITACDHNSGIWSYDHMIIWSDDHMVRWSYGQMIMCMELDCCCFCATHSQVESEDAIPSVLRSVADFQKRNFNCRTHTPAFQRFHFRHRKPKCPSKPRDSFHLTRTTSNLWRGLSSATLLHLVEYDGFLIWCVLHP